MANGTRRKCPHCGCLFKPDPRNHRHQRYCSAPLSRTASKAASQALADEASQTPSFAGSPVWFQSTPTIAGGRDS